MEEEEFADLKRRLLGFLSEQPTGGNVGNKTCRQALGLDEASEDDREIYWAVQNSLVNAGEIEKVRGGNGGSVRLLVAAEDVTEETTDVTGGDDTAESETERGLYGPIKKVLETDWALDEAGDLLAVEDTHHAGRLRTGKWSRPDLTAVLVKRWPYIPDVVLDVVTFEVKRWLDVEGIYEALSHSRKASRSYVLVCSSEDLGEETVAWYCGLASEYGIGVIIAENPSDYSCWRIVNDATRLTPEPELLNEFIARQLSSDTRGRIQSELLHNQTEALKGIAMRLIDGLNRD